MRARNIARLALLGLLLLPVSALAQTTTAGPGIDIEVYNPLDGSNLFCPTVGVPFWANIYVRPGTDAIQCSQACGTVDGGSANLATGAIDLSFDATELSLVSAETNPDAGFAAVDGLVQTQNAAAGRVGWALAGDWNVDGDTGSGLKNACDMQKLDVAGWVYRVQLVVDTPGFSYLDIIKQPGFELSFADMCGSQTFTPGNGDFDQIVSALVTTGPCTTGIFADGFETGPDNILWDLVVGQ